jgi:hypothetical protein
MINDSPSAGFWHACGTTEPVELVVTRADGSEVLRTPLSLPCAVVGRSAEADVRLDDALVSRRHVYVHVVSGRVFCVDLGSRTGTHWRHGTRPSGWLDEGEAIRVGPFFIRAKGATPVPSGGPEASPLSAGTVAAAPRFSLEFLHGTRRRPWQVNRTLTLLGHARVCRVRLLDPGVSGIDCSLLQTAEGLWAIDLLGSGGLAVNDQTLRWAAVVAGDVVRVGPFAFRVREEVAPPVVPVWQPVRRADGADGPRLAEPAVVRGRLVVPELHHPLVALPHAAVEEQRALLLPIVNQFAQMQQQMFDQFQQTILMMVEMFTALHEDQIKVVRQELDGLRALTRELHELQRELLARQGVAAADEPDEATEPAVAPPGNGTSAAADNGSHRPAPAQPRPPQGTPAARTSTASGRGDVHLRIQQRIASIQRERQSRLQKILRFVTGQ